MTNEELQSKTIRFLRFPLIVGIVMIHSHYTELIIDGKDWMKEVNLPVYHLISYFFSEILARVAVPLFFFLSGFLFFYKTTTFNRTIYGEKLKKRIRSLLVPYLFWNLAVIAILFLSQTILPGLMSGNKKLIWDYTFSDWFWSFWDMDKVNPSPVTNLYGMPVCYQLWFIRDLMVTVLFSPLIYWLIKKLPYVILIVLGGLWIGDDRYFYSTGLNITAFFFFSAGAYFSIHRKNFLEKVSPFFSLSAVLYGLLTVIELYTRKEAWNESIHRFDILVGMVFMLALSAHFIEKGKWKVNLFLSDSSFFVYAFHGMPLALAFKFLFKLTHPHTDGLMLTLYFLSPTLVILSGLYLYYLLKKYLPKFTALITGGR